MSCAFSLSPSTFLSLDSCLYVNRQRMILPLAYRDECTASKRLAIKLGEQHLHFSLWRSHLSPIIAFRFLRRLQKSIQRRVNSESEELDPGDRVTSPLLAKSPSLPIKVQKSFKLNRQPRVAPYHSLDASSLIRGHVNDLPMDLKWCNTDGRGDALLFREEGRKEGLQLNWFNILSIYSK